MAIARRETCQQGWRWRWRRWRRPRRPPARDRWCSRWRRWTLTRTQINFYCLSRWFQRGKFYTQYGKDESEKDPNLPKNWKLHGQVLFYLPGWWATRTCLICPRQLSRKLKKGLVIWDFSILIWSIQMDLNRNEFLGIMLMRSRHFSPFPVKSSELTNHR